MTAGYQHIQLEMQPFLRRCAVRLLGVRAVNIYGNIAYYEWRGRFYWCLA